MNKIKEMLHSVTRRMGGEAKAKRIAIMSIFAVILVTLVSATFIINTSDNSVAAREFTVDNITYSVIDETNNTVKIIGVVDRALLSGTIKINTVTEVGGETYDILSIADRVFVYSHNLTGIDIGGKVESIGTSAFDGCEKLETVTMSDNVKSIGHNAFIFTAIINVHIGKNVTDIGSGAFSNITLTTITVDADNPNYTATDNVLFNKDKTTLMQYPGGTVKDTYLIPDETKNIDYSAFRGSGLKSIDFNNVSEIGDYAFKFCKDLETVTMGGVTSIGEEAFATCKALKSVIIPDSVTSIGKWAFQYSSLETVTISNKVIIGELGAFQDCPGLVNVIITGTGIAPTDDSDVISKYFKDTKWGLPGRTTGITTLTLKFSNDYKYDLSGITTIATGKIIFDADTKATIGGPFVTNGSGYNVSGADRAGLTFTCTDKWKAPSTVYGVHFDGNGSTTVNMDDQIFTNGEKALHLNTFVRTGHTFAGWNTQADGSGTSYANGVPITLTFDMCLYAIWTPDTHKVTFDPNLGTGTMGDQTFTFEVPQNLSKNLFTRDGYKFAGWNTQADGSGISYADGASYTIGMGNATLYAQWTPDTYKVTFDINGGSSGIMGDQPFIFGAAEKLSKNLFAKVGHAFAGWNTRADGKGISYLDEALYTIGAGNVTLYAQWTPDTHNVTFNINGGSSGSMGDQTFTFGVAKNLSKNMFTRDGYKFAGWNTQADGKGISYADEASYTIGTENAILYAMWGHSVTPSSGKGGNISPDGNIIVTDGTDKTFTIKADKGFKIKGVTVDGVSVGAVSTYTFSNVTGDHTIYAEFERTSPAPGPVNPTNPDASNGLYLGFIALFAVLLASLVAVLLKMRK